MKKKSNKYKLINKEKFDKLTTLEKRVAICRDVLARIDAGKIKPRAGKLFWNNEVILDAAYTSEKTQNELNSNQCEVCAKGALICSLIGNFNNYSAEQIFDFGSYIFQPEENESRFPIELIDIFGKEFLDIIEVAFEDTLAFGWTQPNTKEIITVYNFFLKKGHYRDDKAKPSSYNDKISNKRLRAVMQNIIKNKGVLKCGDLIIGEIEENNKDK